MTERLRVYLAGPITGCTHEQQTWWREEVKQRLGRQFDFADPTQWADDKEVLQEIEKLDDSQIVLANMWMVSIGTTIGIIRASQLGKPVVLIDPNHMDNPHLEPLVRPEKPVRTIEEACKRVEQLAAELGPLQVRKKSGREQLFYPSKLTRSLTLAAAEAGVTDAAFEERISSRAIANLRRKGRQRASAQDAGYVTSDEIRDELFDQLETMRSHPSTPADLKARADLVLEAWREKERLKRGEKAIKEASIRTQAAEAEAANWKKRFLELGEKGIPQADRPSKEELTATPKFKNVDQVLDHFQTKWKRFVLLHDEARATARHIKPPLKSRELEDLFELLEQLGTFARDKILAAAANETAPKLEKRFGDRYAATESGETKKRYRQEPLEFNGGQYLGLQHLKMKAESGQRIRLYFDELPTGQYLIGWIGHRETYSHDG
jgi:hypothetical protein